MRKVYLMIITFVILILMIFGCSQPAASNNNGSSGSSVFETSQLENIDEVCNRYSLINTPPVTYILNSHTSGVIEKVNNISNLTVVSKDRNVLKAEYQAGFVQGHLQGNTIISARDNSWAPPPSSDELAIANSVMNQNFNYLIGYLKTNSDPIAVQGLKRLLFRMLGIYHGATREHPAILDFSGRFLPDSSYFQSNELTTGYNTSNLTFMDVYFLNASEDFWDVLQSMTTSVSSKSTSKSLAPIRGLRKNMNPYRCSAFLKRTNGDVILAHNSWFYFMSQTMVMTINVNGDMVCLNALSPGLIGSATDFGFNNKGVMFNETTNPSNYKEVKTNGIFIFWRAALAEIFSGSLDDFFHYISIDNTGTYLNAYMLADANTNETGLVDMSYRSFVFFRSHGGPYKITTYPAGQSIEYDARMVNPRYILGYNFAPSLLVRNELQYFDVTTPDRISQLEKMILDVRSVKNAKALITYVDPNVRDNVYARWDILIPPTEFGTMPFGAIDAKVATASMVRDFERLSGDIDLNSSAKGFWMRFGTPYYNGKPFIWSESEFSSWYHPDVPDALDGKFTYLNLHLK
jgi:hypothetical protein